MNSEERKRKKLERLLCLSAFERMPVYKQLWWGVKNICEELFFRYPAPKVGVPIKVENLKKYYQDMVDNNQLQQFSIKNVSSEWDKMTRWDVCKWWLVNVAFYEIGSLLRERWDDNKNYRIENDLEDFMPRWYHTKPKEVLSMDIYLMPVRPLQHIDVTFTIDRNGVMV